MSKLARARPWAWHTRVHTQLLEDGALLLTLAEHKRSVTRVFSLTLVTFGRHGSLRVADPADAE